MAVVCFLFTNLRLYLALDVQILGQFGPKNLQNPVT